MQGRETRKAEGGGASAPGAQSAPASRGGGKASALRGMDFGETEVASLTNDKIKWVQDKPTHGNVEPAAKMKYGDYKGALEATSGNWTKKPGAGGGGGGKPSGGGGKD